MNQKQDYFFSREEAYKIAVVCHDANRAWCATNGDHSQESWAFAEEWQKESAINGVMFRVANLTAPPSAQHDSWMKQKEAEGWVYGEEKDAVAKTHPCMVPYDQLPEMQRKKDALFAAIVMALLPAELSSLSPKYNDADMTSFGNYMVSEARENNVNENVRRAVTMADHENWLQTRFNTVN